MVSKRTKGNEESRQPLLAVDHDERCHAVSGHHRRGSQHHAPEEVCWGRISDRAILVGGEEVVLLQNVLPELAELRGAPGVLALVERNLKLLLPFDERLERALTDLHSSPPWLGLIRNIARWGIANPSRQGFLAG